MPREKFFSQQYLTLASIGAQVHKVQNSVLTLEEEHSPINDKLKDPLESTVSTSEANRLFFFLSPSLDLRTVETECCLVTYSTALWCKWERKVWKHYHWIEFYQKAF